MEKIVEKKWEDSEFTKIPARELIGPHGVITFPCYVLTEQEYQLAKLCVNACAGLEEAGFTKEMLAHPIVEFLKSVNLKVGKKEEPKNCDEELSEKANKMLKDDIKNQTDRIERMTVESTPLPIINEGINQQPIEKQQLNKNGDLDIIDIWPTIQGEGPFSGMPAVFVRLAGCDLQCPGCDTDYTSNRKMMPMQDVRTDIISKVKHPHNLVVLTGGEPFRQNIKPLVIELLKCGYLVQVETNGTLWINESLFEGESEHPWLGELYIVCSPKTAKVHSKIILYAHFWKYILQHGKVDPNDGLPTSSLGESSPPFRTRDRQKIFISPMDEGDPIKNKLNMEAAVESCMKFGYRLSLQTHKILGVK